MHVSAAHQGSEPGVNQEESNGKLPPCVHCQESDNGSLSSPRVVLDLMILSISMNIQRRDPYMYMYIHTHLCYDCLLRNINKELHTRF